MLSINTINPTSLTILFVSSDIDRSFPFQDRGWRDLSDIGFADIPDLSRRKTAQTRKNLPHNRTATR